jgi:acetyl-CoA acetyltransferase
MAAGGMESMSSVPYISRTARDGAGYGHQTLEVSSRLARILSVGRRALPPAPSLPHKLFLIQAQPNCA